MLEKIADVYCRTGRFRCRDRWVEFERELAIQGGISRVIDLTGHPVRFVYSPTPPPPPLAWILYKVALVLAPPKAFWRSEQSDYVPELSNIRWKASRAKSGWKVWRWGRGGCQGVPTPRRYWRHPKIPTPKDKSLPTYYVRYSNGGANKLYSEICDWVILMSFLIKLKKIKKINYKFF